MRADTFAPGASQVPSDVPPSNSTHPPLFRDVRVTLSPSQVGIIQVAIAKRRAVIEAWGNTSEENRKLAEGFAAGCAQILAMLSPNRREA
jgi:hypothetical protein